LSRLEIVLGKIAGFSVVSAAVLLVMWLASLVLLEVSDQRLRRRAAEAYEIQQQDFRNAVSRPEPGKMVVTPNEGLKQMSEAGSLFAYNYIAVPPSNMSILGLFEIGRDGPPTRWIMGGSYEKISYRFSPRLIAPPDVGVRPVGTRPYFEFFFPVRRYTNVPDIKINVSAYCSQSRRVPPPRPQEKTLTLNAQGVAVWEPDNPEELFTPVNPTTLQPLESGDNGEVTVEVRCTTPDVILQVLEGAAPDDQGQLPADADFNVTYFPDPRLPAVVPPLPHPVTRGFERYNRQEISGPKGNETRVECAMYQFPGSSLRHVPVDSQNNFTLAVQFGTFKAAHADRPTHVNIDVISKDNGLTEPYHLLNVEIQEKRVMRLQVPAYYLGNPNPAQRGDMYVRVWTHDQGHSISLLENSVRIELPETPFFVNLLQSELVIFLESVLLIAVAVACSIRLGWPIAMLCSAMCLAFGYFVDFIAELQDYGGLMALNYRPTPGMNMAVFNFFDQATNMLWKVLAFISALVPNFTIYKPTEFIGNLQHMPWNVVGWDLFNTVTFAIPFMALAFLLFRKQELG